MGRGFRRAIEERETTDRGVASVDAFCRQNSSPIKKGMSTALAPSIAKDLDLVSDSSDRSTRAIGLLLS